MQEILELCITFDTRAAETYAAFAANCPDPEVVRTFERMGIDEVAHVGWWTELMGAWDAGLVPDIAEEGALLVALQELHGEITELTSADPSTLSTDQMLDVAARMEFFMLDPLFGELLDLLNPGSSTQYHEAYSHHVMRLVSSIESRHSRGDVAHFLARVLARSFHDQQRLAALAMHDPLTGLYNRRGFYTYARQWSSWSARYDHPLGVLLVDIDHFKTINDRFGHPAGDEALRLVATALGQAVRTSDVVGRYGGDEFSILAPEADAAELSLLMDRVLNVVRDAQFAVEGETVSLSVSVGGALMRGGYPVSPEDLFAAADHALYVAKDSGRDRATAVVEIPDTSSRPEQAPSATTPSGMPALGSPAALSASSPAW